MRNTTKTAKLALAAILLTFCFACEEKEKAKTEADEVAKTETEALAKAAAAAEAAEAFAKAKAEAEAGSVKLLESITDDKGKLQKKFEYDEQNRIVKMYHYIGDELWSAKTVTYNTDDLVTVEDVYSNSKELHEFVRNGNTITVEYPPYSTLKLTINEDGYIVRSENIINNDAVIYQYQGGNLIKQEKADDSNYCNNYNKHDDKKSPFSNTTTPKWVLQQVFDYHYANKNNILEYSNEGEIIVDYEYKYEYDSEGFPIKQAYVEGEEQTEITRFTYIGKTK